MEAGNSSRLYLQIYQDMMNKIQSDYWQDGQKLPTEAQLCELYSASRITIRRALQMLEDEGHLVRTPRKGTFVKKGAVNISLRRVSSFLNVVQSFEQSGDFYTLLVRFEGMPCPENICAELRISPDEKVYYMERVRYNGSYPMECSYTYLPQKLVPDLTADIVRTQGLYKAIQSLGGTVPTRAQETFSAVLLDGKSAKRLNRPNKSAALCIQQTTFCGNTPFEFSETIFGNGTMKYEFSLL